MRVCVQLKQRQICSCTQDIGYQPIAALCSFHVAVAICLGVFAAPGVSGRTRYRNQVHCST